jgi:hypothetical protein
VGIEAVFDEDDTVIAVVVDKAEYPVLGVDIKLA